MKNKTKPLQRSIARLTSMGFRCKGGIAEKWVPHYGGGSDRGGRRVDLFGIIDLVALRRGVILGIQCCAASGFGDHHRKIIDGDGAAWWLLAGGRLQLHGWYKPKVDERRHRLRVYDYRFASEAAKVQMERYAEEYKKDSPPAAAWDLITFEETVRE